MKMKPLLIMLGLTLTPMTHAVAYDQRGDCDREWRDDCGSQSYDQWQNEDRNRNRNRNRGAFSPGPFDRSPVDIHDNQVCISPDCSGGGQKRQPPDQKPRSEDVVCTLENLPFHCDPKPEEIT